MSEETPYEVGYGRPPKHTQFKPGQSGNPRNKQKRTSETFAQLIDRALNRLITVRVAGKSQRMTIIEAVTRQLINAAASGKPEAVDLLSLVDAYAKRISGCEGGAVIVEIVPDKPRRDAVS